MKKSRKNRETLIRRKMSFIKRFDEIVNETPEEYKKDLSKSHFYERVADELNYSVQTVSSAIVNRNKVLKEYKELFGENA